MNKKWILRVTVVLAVVISALLMVAPVMAMWDWCEVDPALNINGHTVNIVASIQGNPQDINGKIKFVVVVPEGVSSSIISCDHAGKVKIDTGTGAEVEVFAYLKTKTTYASQLIVNIDGNQVAFARGTTDNQLTCTFDIQ
jgi:hypothetical protein